MSIAGLKNSDKFTVPGRLWSLWDIMTEFKVWLLVTHLSHIERFENSLRGSHQLGNQQLSLGDSPDGPLTEVGRKWLLAHLKPLLTEIEPLKLNAAPTFIQNVLNHAHTLPAKDIALRLKDLRWAIGEGLRDKFFLYLDSQEATFFNEKLPFGQAVADAFQSAEMDILEAAKCLALGRNNAVVHHLMLAAEFGLRALAADRRVVITNRIVIKFHWSSHNGEKSLESCKRK